MKIINALLEGILQGITEFLPISSDGHLTLFQHFTGTSGKGSMLFTLILHLGTLLSVFIAFRKTIWNLIREFFTMIGDLTKKKVFRKKTNDQRKMIIMILISIIPLIGFYFVKDFFTALAEDNDIIVEGILFLVTATMLFLADKSIKGHKSADNMKPSDALITGVAQGFAALPAVSRSGSTISVLLLKGFSREYAVAFSFIMGIPAIIGANIFEINDAINENIQIDPLCIIVGITASAIVGILAIKLVRFIVKTDRLSIFAYYTALLGIVTISLGILENFGIIFRFEL